MKRTALIIYCDNTESGQLAGPAIDNENYVQYLQSNIGGQWYKSEIHSLRNPTSALVKTFIDVLLSYMDYTFIIFSGHGLTDFENNNLHFIELTGGNHPVSILKTNAARQTLIIDSCRNLFRPMEEPMAFSKRIEGTLVDDVFSTRDSFSEAVLSADTGWSILYSAGQGQASADTPNGGAYLFSLLKTAERWETGNVSDSILPLNVAHNLASNYVQSHFLTIQTPYMQPERRRIQFPFAVKCARPRA